MVLINPFDVILILETGSTCPCTVSPGYLCCKSEKKSSHCLWLKKSWFIWEKQGFLSSQVFFWVISSNINHHQPWNLEVETSFQGLDIEKTTPSYCDISSPILHPNTNEYPWIISDSLKIGGEKRLLSCWGPAYFQELCYSFVECMYYYNSGAGLCR